MIAGESARCGKTSAKMDIAFSFQKTTLKCWFSEKIDYSTTVSYRHHPYRTDWTKAAVIMGPCNLKWYKGYSVLLRQRVRMSAWSCSMSDFGQRRLLSESLCSSARATKIHTSKIRGNFRILAIPANTAASRPFTGIAVKKRPHLPPSGKRYIDIGEGWERGIALRQILVGPCASRNLQDVLNSFSCLPEIIYVDVPEYPEQAS